MEYITKDHEAFAVLRYFEDISRVPRGSGNSCAIAEFFENFARERSLQYYRDGADNVLIRKAATAGFEASPPVLLQGHSDMVCEKNEDNGHSFLTDGIRLRLDGDILSADGTTLGGDDGIACAVMLALLDSDSIPHPELECLFTSDEEIGLLGMEAFDASLLRSRRMINIDSMGEGQAIISCAGGVRTEITLEGLSFAESDGACVKLSVTGLSGGHSGENINEGKINAVKLAARICLKLAREYGCRLVSISGGNKDNAIPREAEVILACRDSDSVKAAATREFDAIISAEATACDRGAELTLSECRGERALSPSDTVRVLSLLDAMPYGVLAMLPTLPSFVETSANLGAVSTDGTALKAVALLRSSNESKLDGVMQQLEALAALADGKACHYSRYPGWSPSEDSPLVELFLDIYREMSGKEGEALGIHAGLECGVLKGKVPDMDMISIGPELYNIHTPDEHLSVPSVARMWELIKRMLARM